MYYKDWITEGIEAPSIPHIETPLSVQAVTKEGLRMSGPVNRNPLPQPMVSKRLYDEVFKFSKKSGSKSEVREEEEDVEVVREGGVLCEECAHGREREGVCRGRAPFPLHCVEDGSDVERHAQDPVETRQIKAHGNIGRVQERCR